MIGFELYPLDSCILYGGYYSLLCEKGDLNDVNLCMATTTCRKETFIKKNVGLVKSEILSLDDDILILPESIIRTYKLLRLIKPEYRNHFISGGMLYYERPNCQHEEGYRRGGTAVFPLMSLIKMDWPLFIRGDDVEYSLRCKAKIITMNGICIWHLGFDAKYNAAIDKYQQYRNLMIDKASSDVMRNVNIYGLIKRSFRAELSKFNYNAAETILRGFEDYLRGPNFLKTVDGEKNLKEIMKLHDKMKPLNDMEEVKILNVWDCFFDPPRKRMETFLYRLTYNGHRFWSGALRKKDDVYIAFNDSGD